MPDPMPRPTRTRAVLAPLAGLMLFSFISDLFHLQHERRLADHAEIFRGCRNGDRRMGLTKTQTADTILVHLQLTEGAADQGALALLGLRHGRISQPRISSTVLPRLAAISDGIFMFLKASIVARTTLIALREPNDLASTFCTPAASNTARI